MTEFTINLANRPGQLADFAQLLADGSVNVEALTAYTIENQGVVRVVVDDPAVARRLLAETGLAVEEREVLTTVLANRPGTLAEMTRKLAQAGVNIDALYVLRSSAAGLELALAVNDLASSRSQLMAPAGGG